MSYVGSPRRRNHTDDSGQTFWLKHERGRENRKINSSWMDHLSWKSFWHGWEGYILNTRYFLLALSLEDLGIYPHRYRDRNVIKEAEPQPSRAELLAKVGEGHHGRSGFRLKRRTTWVLPATRIRLTCVASQGGKVIIVVGFKIGLHTELPKLQSRRGNLSFEKWLVLMALRSP